MRPFSEEELLALSTSSPAPTKSNRSNTLTDYIFNALVSRVKFFWRTVRMF